VCLIASTFPAWLDEDGQGIRRQAEQAQYILIWFYFSAKPGYMGILFVCMHVCGITFE
jgi:hypothetical protein